MTLAFASRFDIPFFTGIPSATPLVPSVWDVAIGGHTFMLDLRQEGLFGHQTIPHQRPTSFVNVELGERALNPDAGWRVSQSTWHKGAGQSHLDLLDSDPAMFFASKGIDCWTQWQTQLLNDTTAVRASGNANLQCVSVGTYLYISDGNEVYWTTNLSAYTAATINIAEGAQAVKSITTDGFNVYAALGGANGVHKTTKSATVSTHWNDLQATLVKWCKGRLMAAKTNAIYVIPTATGSPATAPGATFTHDNTDFTWVGFTDGDQAIYAAGFSGDRSEVYQIPIKSDGSGLSAPVIAAVLPAGEIAYSIGSYLGFVLVGTNLGLRVCQATSTGDLRVGPAIVTNQPVRCVEGYGKYVWFGWESFDSSSSGLGRVDLTVFNDVAPAYASDLMGPAGTVTSVGTFGGKRVFAVNSVGFYCEATVPVTSGYLDSGIITYDIAESKVAVALSARHAPPFKGSHEVFLGADDDALADMGAVVFNGNLSMKQKRAEHYTLRNTLVSDGTAGPVLRRWTLISMPAPRSAEKITVPVQLYDNNVTNDGQDHGLDVQDEFEYLTGLRDSREVISYSEGRRTLTVTMTDFRWVPSDQQTHDRSFWQGTLVCELTTVDTE